uniref:Uncharacterized protein n=1 Tax=Triticum urartu TaxID=4572 RepID=A0A8R7UIX9_TRIUA
MARSSDAGHRRRKQTRHLVVQTFSGPREDEYVLEGAVGGAKSSSTRTTVMWRQDTIDTDPLRLRRQGPTFQIRPVRSKAVTELNHSIYATIGHVLDC